MPKVDIVIEGQVVGSVFISSSVPLVAEDFSIIVTDVVPLSEVMNKMGEMKCVRKGCVDKKENKRCQETVATKKERVKDG